MISKQKLFNFFSGTLLAQGVINDFFRNQVRSQFGTQAGPAGSETAGALITSVLQLLLLFAGSLAVIFLVLGGVQYVTSRGNEEAAEKAKKTMTAAIVGLVIIIMAFAIVYIISNILIANETGIL